MSRLHLALLGPPEIMVDDQPLKTDRRKAVALLAYLAVTGRPQARAALATLLWPGYASDSAAAYLRRTLWELNQTLGKGRLDADRDHVQLALDPADTLDVTVFCTGLRAGAANIADLTAALDLYRGEFLAGFSVPDTETFADWQTAQAEALRRDFAGGLQRLVDALTAAGDLPGALAQARRWLALDPLHEPAHRAAMRLLALSGDRAAALRHCEAATATLQAELRAAPEPETLALYEAIRRGELTGAPPTSAPAPRRVVVDLPALATPFIGRRAEVEHLLTLLRDPAHRLITLVGVGGAGKTRLSLQAAGEVCGYFPDGVYFAPLAAVPSAAGVLPALAKAVRFLFYREQESHRQQLFDYLRDKRLLLLLDNFEHLLDAAPLAADLLAHAPHVKLLVTSRSRLNLPGEQLCHVSGMRLPTPAESDAWPDPTREAQAYSAVQLFLDRARRVRPDFTLSRANLDAVLAIGRLTQGMPLALELAATWMGLLPPAEIAAELARSLDFLETDQAGVPDRQRSLRAVFESSYQLLNDEERAAFEQLCVFSSSFAREAAQHVADASLRTLLGLANKSWLQQTEDGRFQLHDLMRQLGAERLRATPGAWQAAHARHAAYFLGFAEAQLQRLRGPGQVEAVQALELEFDTNLRATWEWLAAAERWADLTGPLADALHEYGEISWRQDELIPWLRPARLALNNRSEPEARLAFVIVGTLEIACEESAQGKDDNPVERLGALWQLVLNENLAEPMGYWFVLLASMVSYRNLDPTANEHITTALDRLRRRPNRWLLGKSLLFCPDIWRSADRVEAVLLEAAQIFDAIGGPFERGTVAELRGSHAMRQRRPIEEIVHLNAESQRYFAQLRGRLPSGQVHTFIIGAYLQSGHIDRAFAQLLEEQRYLERLGNERLLSHSLHWYSLYAGRYRTYAEALATRQRSRELVLRRLDQSERAWQAFELGDVHRAFGEYELAQAAFDEAQAVFRQAHHTLGLGFCRRASGDLALAAGRYAEALEHYQAYLGLAQQDNHRWSIAQAQAKLALAHAWRGEAEAARRALRQSVPEAYAIGQNDLLLQGLLAEAVGRLTGGQPAAALELAALVAQHPVTWNETRAQAQDLGAQAAALLNPAEAAAAERRGRALAFETALQPFLGPALAPAAARPEAT
ncbi:MAG: hypothetical protein IT317_23075 [Anaerolineales bacterium]|nr:hypothetical protein [Anaerolineales bacterium]